MEPPGPPSDCCRDVGSRSAGSEAAAEPSGRVCAAHRDGSGRTFQLLGPGRSGPRSRRCGADRTSAKSTEESPTSAWPSLRPHLRPAPRPASAPLRPRGRLLSPTTSRPPPSLRGAAPAWPSEVTFQKKARLSASSLATTGPRNLPYVRCCPRGRSVSLSVSPLPHPILKPQARGASRRDSSKHPRPSFPSISPVRVHLNVRRELRVCSCVCMCSSVSIYIPVNLRIRETLR